MTIIPDQNATEVLQSRPQPLHFPAALIARKERPSLNNLARQREEQHKIRATSNQGKTKAREAIRKGDASFPLQNASTPGKFVEKYEDALVSGTAIALIYAQE